MDFHHHIHTHIVLWLHAGSIVGLCMYLSKGTFRARFHPSSPTQKLCSSSSLSSLSSTFYARLDYSHQHANIIISLKLLFVATPVACGGFPGHRLNPCHSSNPSHCSDSAGSLTHWAMRELLKLLLVTFFSPLSLPLPYFFALLCNRMSTKLFFHCPKFLFSGFLLKPFRLLTSKPLIVTYVAETVNSEPSLFSSNETI